MKLPANISRLAELARQEEVPAYAGDLCSDVWGRLHYARPVNREFTVTGFCFAVASSAIAATLVLAWLYSSTPAEQSSLESIFLSYDPLYSIAALSGI